MKSYKTVDEYILNAETGRDILIVLREILKNTELTETVKWGGPVYTIEGKNVVGIGSFKSYAGLWFYQGALLADKAKVLINAQEDVTKALRQWRFNSADEIDEKLLLEYVAEAIKNERQGKKIMPDKNKPLVIPEELENALNEDKALKACFLGFSKSCQREFAQYVSDAKRAETRLSRVEKIIPMILEKKGLNDKYRK